VFYSTDKNTDGNFSAVRWRQIVVSLGILSGFEKSRNEAIFANNIKGGRSAKADRNPIRGAQKPICARKKPIYAGAHGCYESGATDRTRR
jgi:hypothetical protein